MSEEMKAAAIEELGQPTTEVAPQAAAATQERREASTEVAQWLSVVTKMVFAAPPAQVWDGLVFYEELGGRPPWHLRLLLPVPIRTEGKVSAVGDEATCLYEGGHLLQAHHENRTGRPLRVRSRRAGALRRRRHAALWRPLHLARPARRANRSLGRDALPQPQMAALVLEAARENGLPFVPPLPLGLDAAAGRSRVRCQRA